MKNLLASILLLFVFIGINYSQCGCTKLVFIVDNSGSISGTEFISMKRSIDSISSQLLRQYPTSEITVIQYGTQDTSNHTYNVTVPFTSNPVTARTWSRAYATGGTVNSTYYQDHLPGSMERMKRDSIWYAGKSADLVTGACNIRMFVFTDAYASNTYCCTDLTNVSNNAHWALPNFGEYNWHKTTFSSDWTVYHVTSFATAMQAGAAIASKGGSYSGTISANPGDPQGSGGPRKYYAFSTFNLTQQNIDTALANINASAFSVDFPNDTLCLGDSAVFTTNLLSSVGYVKWDFGDGTFDSVNLNTKHLYTSAGAFNVTVIVRSLDSACEDTVTKEVYVNPTLNVDFTFDTACLTGPTTFTNTTTGSQSTLRWSFGDGTFSTFKPDTSHLYGTPGVFPVTLFVRSSSVCSDSITKNVLVNDRPDVNFSVSNECQFLNVSPSNTTSVITSNLATLNWDWDFGDGGASSVQNPTYSYSLAGNYTVELIATTPEGCSDTITKPIVISEKPIASYNVAVACLTQTTDFIDASTLSSGAITNWQWSSPVSSTSQNTSHVFASAGTYPITLTVTTDSSCVDDTTINVVVRPLPVPNFVFSPSEIFTFDTKVCFTNLTTGGVSYFWDFDFGGSQGVSYLNAPCTVSFPSDGEGRYNVKLVATNQYGCKDSIYKELVVIEDFILYAPSSFTPNEDGINDEFSVSTQGIEYFEMFIYNRWGELMFTSTDPKESWDGKYKGTLAQGGNYVYKITAKSQNGLTKKFDGHFILVR